MNARTWTLVIVLFFISLFPIFYKTQILGVSFMPTVQKGLWTIEVITGIQPSESFRRIHFPIPKPSERLFIKDSKFDGKGMALTITRSADGYFGTWRGRARTKRSAYYKVVLGTRDLQQSPPGPDTTAAYSASIRERYLALPEFSKTQLDALTKIENEIVPKTGNKTRIAKALYYFINEEILYNSNKNGSKVEDVVETLESDSLGKSKLLMLLCRRQQIPARIVGGILLRPQKNENLKGKRRIFYWNEIYLNNKWYSACPTYGHFASLTAAYLPLFWNLESVKDILNDNHAGIRVYANKVVSREFTINEYRKELQESKSWLLQFSLYTLPMQVQAIFKILLLIPLGGVVLAFFRNIIGFRTFGIFMPILLALFFKESTFVFGVSFFSLLVALGFIERYLLEKLHLLAVPRLSIILTLVVAFLCIFAIANQSTRWFHNFTPAMFPIVITSIFIERFSIMIVEEGLKNTTQALLGTLVIALISYWLFSIQVLQVIVFTYPETLLSMIAVFILIGKYTGYRLSEFLRFREMLKKPLP
ncbi:MAG TPA: UUP1 family membrane protein [Spirochaetota bacterium]|nr:UUP1 family membrane protein [Spirochaetota bacterium]HPQ52881.1 UUP1 family membrane protein [Spirochaetota bacterium]